MNELKSLRKARSTGAALQRFLVAKVRSEQHYIFLSLVDFIPPIDDSGW